MSIDSPLFDRIRVKPDQDRRLRAQNCPACEWPGCKDAATYRAPKGRLRENEYWRFCLDHVREYNHSYNFFAGMSDDAIVKYQKDAITGHRPTWKMGMTGGGRARTKRADPGRFYAGTDGAEDPFDLLREFSGEASARPNGERLRQRETRVIRNAERKALDTLGLEANASVQEVKTRFKTLVKRHHPDANGGDRSTEDRLREIIQAYNYLKSVGFR